MDGIKIAIIGDYNFTFNAHHATNLALDHASFFLDVDINYYWIRVQEIAQHRIGFFDRYDAFWIAPGPFLNSFYLNGLFARIASLNKPVIMTGESFRFFLEFLIAKNNLNPGNEKLISDNLVVGSYFENIQITPKSESFKKLYEHFSPHELSAVRYSLYPNLMLDLVSSFVDIEAVNQFEDIEAVSMKNHPFFVALSYYPQVTSTRDLPHPVVYTFVKAAMNHQQLTHSLV
jgi:CTP synthase (UTP-ammonia lyase)